MVLCCKRRSTFLSYITHWSHCVYKTYFNAFFIQNPKTIISWNNWQSAACKKIADIAIIAIFMSKIIQLKDMRIKNGLYTYKISNRNYIFSTSSCNA